MLYTPFPYQQTATLHILKNPAVLECGGAFMALDMGLGKSVITATAAQVLIHQWKWFDKCLIIAPKLVAEQSWPAEFEKWDHLKGMTISVVAGNAKQRAKALQKPANVYIIGQDNIAWLVAAFNGFWPFKFVIIDEIQGFKNSNSVRFKSLRLVRPQIQKIVGLTGTPAPNGLIDLWAQIFLMDQGQRLGQYVTHYRKKYFTWKTKDDVEYDYRIKEESDPLLGKDINAKLIADQISDISMSMKSEDYLDLPERIDIFSEVNLHPAILEQYKQFEKESVTHIADEEITAFSAPALYSKLLQFANGAVYDTEHTYHAVHEAKLDMLEEIVEQAQVSDTPVLVIYNFQSDVDRIKKRLARFKPYKQDGPESIKRWNRGEIKVFLLHSLNGKGLNMQEGSNILAWFGLPWGLEQYQQTVKRLHRLGQQKRVSNYHLLCKGTLEWKVAKRLEDKAITQDDLFQSLKAELKDVRLQGKPRESGFTQVPRLGYA